MLNCSFRIDHDATIKVGICVTEDDCGSSDQYAYCYACGFYVPMTDIGSHDRVCPATDDEKKAVQICFLVDG